MKEIFQKNKAGRLYISLIISGIILSIIHLISPYFPLKFLWGFSFYRFFPFPFQITFLLLGILICIPYINKLINKIINTILVFLDNIFSHLPKNILFIFISSFFLIIFWILRSRRLYGDGVSAGYVIKNSIYLTSDGFYNSIFIFFHYLISNSYEFIFARNYPYGYFVTFGFINCLLGSLFIFLLLVTISLFSDDFKKLFFIFSLILFQGGIQIYFGHIESYAVPLTGGMLFILLSFYYLENKTNIFSPSLVLILTSILKVTTLQLYPALILLPFLKRKKYKNIKLNRDLLLISVMPILGILTYLLISWKTGKLNQFFELIFSSGNFLSFINSNSPSHLYTFISFDYLIAILNELILIFPYGILLTIFLIIFYRKEIDYTDPYFLFFIVMSLFCLLYNLIAYPMLGPFRDWDKYSLTFLPVSLSAVYLLNKYMKSNKDFFSISLLVVTFSLIHTVPWILANNQMTFSFKPATKYTYVKDFLAGNKYLKTSIKFPKNNNLKDTKGFKWFLKAIKYDENLGGSNDKIAMQYYIAAIIENPDFSEARNNLAVIYDKMELYNDAADEFRKALDINPELAESHNNLGSLYADWMWWDKAYFHHKKATELNPYLAESHNNLGVDYADVGRYKDAIQEFKKALILNSNLEPSKKYLIIISGLTSK